ncbi:hypothetical protein M2271_002157 [Streptomyces sp. LBL]|uniref:hypothetical protein n=1 Tax=Streptomyces sp. LBL TaxID=2940562 RepID=UPI002475CC4B|nr:hypothetical protein [Streptomyces sp. LBL]MDH6624355.1 hypothetical protein [Streptomyces sp. LBL]
MKRFEPRFQGRPWVSGTSVLHLYATPVPLVDTGLFTLAAACRQAMEPYPVWPVPDDLIHITVEMDAWARAEQITPAQRERLVNVLTRRLAEVEPGTVWCGSPIVNKAGVLLDTYPDEHLRRVQNVARAALWEVHDSAALAHDGGRMHAQVGYAWDDSDSDPLQSTLRTISPSHARMTVSHLHLLDVTWSERPVPGGGTRWEMEWTPLAAIPLGGPRPTTPAPGLPASHGQGPSHRI